MARDRRPHRPHQEATLGCNDPANLDDGTMRATAFALTALTAEDEARIAALVKRAAS
ncbi:hypothetical protein [Nonomuraea sp. NPDC050786]|uniref:hypothetical protein n=1 Tax=Nonomuraea sp. NPDC050786 TaxID=3154840 RepID=UPI003400BB20